MGKKFVLWGIGLLVSTTLYASDGETPVATVTDAEDEQGEEVMPVTWEEVSEAFAENCFPCHRGSRARRGLDLQSEELAVSKREIILFRVQGGTMPPRAGNFAAGEDGQLIIRWAGQEDGTEAEE